MGMAAGWISELPLYNYFSAENYNVIKFGLEPDALSAAPGVSAVSAVSEISETCEISEISGISGISGISETSASSKISVISMTSEILVYSLHLLPDHL